MNGFLTEGNKDQDLQGQKAGEASNHHMATLNTGQNSGKYTTSG